MLLCRALIRCGFVVISLMTERNLRVLGNDIEMRFNLSCEFFEESSRFFVDAEESTGENFDLFLENTDEQLLFGAEVIVTRAWLQPASRAAFRWSR